MAVAVTAWVIFGAVLLGVLLLSYGIARYFSDPEASERLPTFAATLGLSLSLLVVLLTPVDIYLVSIAGGPDAAESDGDAIRALYYVLYGAILAVTFVLVPFAYFYYEEDDIGISQKDRILAALKYAAVLLLILVILLVIGLVLKVGKTDEDDDERQWVRDLFDSESNGDGAIAFAIACVAIIGYACSITYTAFGLAALPMDLIVRRKGSRAMTADTESTLTVNRERMRAIKDKYAFNPDASMTAAERRQLRQLERKEESLTRRNEQIQKQERWERVAAVCAPFRILFGILFMLFSLFLVSSLAVATLDKFFNSICGWSCGYVLDEPEWINPFDESAAYVSKWFPTDYVLLGITLLYVLFATIKGLTAIGVRFFWLHMYRVRRRASVPQAVLMLTSIIMLVLVAFSVQLLTLAPQYVSFGQQSSCTVTSPTDECFMSQIAVLVNRITVKTPFFAVVYFVGDCAAVGIFVLTAFVRPLCCRGAARDADDSDDDSDDERAGLLRGSSRRR